VTIRDLKFLFLFSSLFVLAACGGGGGGGGDDSGNNNNSGNSDVDAQSDGGGLTTRCGVIVDGSLRNPIDSGRGEPVSLVSVLDSNAVIVSDGSSQMLVKLQGVEGTIGFTNTAAQSLFAELSAEQLYFFSAGCTGAVIGGQTATVGQIVTASGKSFTEELIARKYAGVIETAGSCGEDALSACYTNVSVTNEHHVYGPAEQCEPAPASVRYRPSDADCGGMASLVMSGEFQGAFSVQLRYPDGTDRIIESCESAYCTPLKVQQYLNTETLKVACFGAPGNSVALSDVNHVSIKREADDHEPPRFCIADPSSPIN